ncbi:MAG TPA: calcium-binding EGF-like domain-containing protein [Myxococcales bacterium]
MRHCLSLLMIAGLAAASLLSSCSSTPQSTGLPVGSACSAASDCANPPTAACFTEFKPVKGLVKEGTDPGTKAAFEAIGLDFPGGYCSNTGNCAKDSDCSTGGKCYLAMDGVSQATIDGLSATVPFDVAKFKTMGLCLKACEKDTDCRQGYKCGWPLGDFMQMVEGATKKNFCIEIPDPCKAAPCANGGTCKKIDDLTFECTCPTGFSGTKCETNIDDCAAGPCQHGATCTDGVNDFVCTCPMGYSGKTCDTNIDECTPNPCKNGAACTDGIGDYTCACAAGWDGKNCDIELNGCTPTNPCKNGGTCTPAGGGDFTCACTGTWSGKTCEEKCGQSTLITYALTGKFKLSGTTGGMGDGEWPLPGADVRTGGTPAVTTASLTLRVHQDGVHAAITSFDLGHNIHQKPSFGPEIYTNILHTSKKDVCGVASGTIAGTTLTWDQCTTPANYGKIAWVPTELASGPGCLVDAGSEGNINCTGSTCSMGGLAVGDNAVTRPPMWPQPLSAFTFAAADLKSFSSAYWFQPNEKKNAITQLKIDTAVETGRKTEVTPDCACPQ